MGANFAKMCARIFDYRAVYKHGSSQKIEKAKNEKLAKYYQQ